MIPAGIVTPFLFFFALGLYCAVPFPLTVLFFLILVFPAILPAALDHAPKGRASSFFRRLSEAVTAVYLYLLIVLLADACVLLIFHYARLSLSFPLLFGISAALYGAVITAGVLHARKIAVRKHEIRLPCDGVNRGKTRVVFFSDLHLGFSTTKKMLKRLGETISAQSPDCILFGGDLFDCDYADLRHPKEALAFLRSLPCPDGFWLCPGNHDAYATDGARIREFIAQSGVRMLRDELVPLPFFDLFARRDADEQRFSASEVCASTMRTLVVLDHQPKETEKLIDGGASLVLSGHTHNGQTFPGNVLAAMTGRYNYGAKTYKNGFAVTTAGAGWCGLPMRFLTSCEIVTLDLYFE